MSSLARKWMMALTGLFLCLFLLGHLNGNLILLKSGIDAQIKFNEYSHFMTTNPLIKILSYVTYLSILLHVVFSVILYFKNRSVRLIQYARNNASANSTWQSRNMIVLGVLLLLFIIIHLKSFWYEMHFGSIPAFEGNKDLYTMVIKAFSEWWYTLSYVVFMTVGAFHLLHGFTSAFQSLGIHHAKYTLIIKFAGIAFAILIPLVFAAVPVYIFFNNVTL